MFTLSKEVVPLSDPGGVGQCGDRQMRECAGWETTFRSTVRNRLPELLRSWRLGFLPPLPKLLGSTHCGRQGNPHELYISWQKPLTLKGVRAWRPPFGEAELLVEASRSSVSPLVTLVWNVPINKLWLLRQSGWRQCPRVTLLSSQYLGCWISLSQLTVRQEQVSYT